jgi:hypothetical protein
MEGGSRMHRAQPFGATIAASAHADRGRHRRLRVAISAAPRSLGTGDFDRSPLVHRILHPQSVHRGQTKYPVPDGLVPLRARSLRDGVHRASSCCACICSSRATAGCAGRQWFRCTSAVEGNDRGDEVLRLHPPHAGFEGRPQCHGGVSYIGIYALVLVEIVTGLVMFNWLRHSPILTGRSGRVDSAPGQHPEPPADPFLPDVRVHRVRHLPRASVPDRLERGEARLLDSIFTGYKIIPVDELGGGRRRSRPESPG